MDIPERVKRCLDRHPDWTNPRISKSTGGRLAVIEAIRKGEQIPVAIAPPAAAVAVTLPAAPPGDFTLAGVQLLSKKPTDGMKARIYGLRRGVGYKLDSLARAWNVSVDTLKNHAKNHNALVYVEATPGEYVACIVHPETQRGDAL